ncbi:hypothetical protein Z043_122687 [Scleropages formosus]|uniref:Integrin beta subunit cytoplasmic domain-containing protein n=1 Tax=Scleropages formosus TaxID=113540 RepID=A0A0P7Y156_SCLFO|nr:hypothetical protein Z043_122687 [Scleropages formosus]
MLGEAKQDHSVPWHLGHIADYPVYLTTHTTHYRVLECPEPVSIGAVVGGAFAGVALIGLLILITIKGIMRYQDLQEYKKFEQERSKAAWSENVSPMYQAATTTVLNPNYTGD